ncbi:MAG: trans-aconitate 2-methyltransferase [Alsobacter sp.]
MAAPDWNAAQYLKFEDERTRPPSDLIARVPLAEPGFCVDLGCGPGNSTELIVRRFPSAVVAGMDSSPDMLAKARARLPGLTFSEGDVATWTPERPPDLLFANAVLQWVPGHAQLFPRLAALLAPGGVLAVQMPDNLGEPSHLSIPEAASAGSWASRLKGAEEARGAIGSFADYWRWLREAGCAVDLWRTTYVHPLAGPDAIVEWFKSTALKPWLDRLDGADREGFLAAYRDRIAAAYPAERDGTVLLRFPRLFIVAKRAA